jgi:hypothetical protein
MALLKSGGVERCFGKLFGGKAWERGSPEPIISGFLLTLVEPNPAFNVALVHLVKHQQMNKYIRSRFRKLCNLKD